MAVTFAESWLGCLRNGDAPQQRELFCRISAAACVRAAALCGPRVAPCQEAITCCMWKGRHGHHIGAR